MRTKSEQHKGSLNLMITIMFVIILVPFTWMLRWELWVVAGIYKGFWATYGAEALFCAACWVVKPLKYLFSGLLAMSLVGQALYWLGIVGLPLSQYIRR